MKILIGFLVFSCFLLSCQTDKKNKGDDRFENMVGIASPIYLNNESVTFPLMDYFHHPAVVDSIQLLTNTEEAIPQLSIQIAADSTRAVTINNQGFEQPYSIFRCHVGNEQYDILMQYEYRQKKTFTLADKGYKIVGVKGEMNEWNPTLGSMTLSDGQWQVTMDLKPNSYQYQFVADGNEMLDPTNENKVSNGIGGFNSQCTIFPLSDDPAPQINTVAHNGHQVTIQRQQPTTKLVAFWDNTLLPVAYTDAESIHIDIPTTAMSYQRSHLRLYSYNKAGKGNDILIPLEYGQPIQDTKHLSRQDYPTQIMYFALIDRFKDSNTANDKPVNDPRVDFKANYQGGDLSGIVSCINDGYFQSLGINSLWLSPITTNPDSAWQEYPKPHRWYSGYHGYWPISSSQVDTRLGTNEGFQSLVNRAHEKDINVLLDFVCNHVHIEHPLYKEHPDWVTPFDLPDGRKNLRLWDEQRLTTWFDEFIPTLDLERPEVINVQVDSALYWLKTFDIDGFRHDATKHIPKAFWRELTHRAKLQYIVPNKQHIYQIGETYGSRDLIRDYMSSGMMECQFDFPFYDVAIQAIAHDGDLTQVAESLRNAWNMYGYHNTMGYISGNHDKPRFISLAGGAIQPGDDEREIGWEKNIGVGDPKGYKLLQLLHAINFAIPGVPVIYYGDEIGMPGAGDPDCRRMMRFDNLAENEQQTLHTVQKLAALRQSRISLLYGDSEILYESPEQIVFLRSYFGENTIIALNKSTEPVTLTLELPAHIATSHSATWASQWEHTIAKTDQGLTITIPALSFDYITN